MNLSQEPIMKMKCCKLCSYSTDKRWKAYMSPIIHMCWRYFTAFNYSLFVAECESSRCNATKRRIILVSMYSVSRNAIEGNSKDLSIYVNLWRSYIIHLSSVYNYICTSLYCIIDSSLLVKNGNHWRLW